jgi:dipeptidyl aminopeptidase/acylaminoacyl peptidase
MRSHLGWLAVLLFGVPAAFSGDALRPASPGQLTIDALTRFRHPTFAGFSPDGRRLAFVWDESGVQNLYLTDVDRPGAQPTALTSFKEGAVDSVRWTKDGQALLFVHDGDLWQVPSAGGTPRAVWTTPEAEGAIALSPDGTRIAFVRGGQPSVPEWARAEGSLWVRSLANRSEVRLTEGPEVVSGPSWSPDGSRIAFALTPVTLKSETPEYSGAKILYTRADRGAATPAVLSMADRKIVKLAPSRGMETTPAWLDASRLLVQRVSADSKIREIAVVNVGSAREQVIQSETDSKFWSLPFVAADPAPSPNGAWVAFVSDRDGWDHLYVVPSTGGLPVQVTRGTFEVRDLSWSPDGTRIAFSMSEAGRPGTRQVAVATIGANAKDARLTTLTTGRGTNTLPAWSPSGGSIVYQHTDARNSADLFLVASAAASGSSTRLTDSMPDGIDKSALVEPELVKYAAPDGAEVPAYLFVPKGLDRSRKHPAIVWIHGDGINQNYDGWHTQLNYATYYGFHQYLVQRGYVVLAPDYRGSIGYGRDWRQGVYMDVGGGDARDASAAGDYLTTLAYVDSDRIGVWGLSYGGYFTLLALADRPTLFRCGVNVAGSVDYRMWYQDPGGVWVVGRMGTPESNPDLYQRSSALDRAHQITRPLLVLAGTADLNVPYIETVNLMDRLLKGGKDVDFMMYPGEYHYFIRAHVLKDAWQRVERFFGKHLHSERTPSKSIAGP